jgi:tetratricopeptide (TPR) repeat protein
MSPSSEELLQEAVRLHQVSEYQNGIKTAEAAREMFLKEGRPDRAIEALRVMADCSVNAREMKRASMLYEKLMQEAVEMMNIWYQSAAHWGLGQVSLRQLNYPAALDHFTAGLDQARKIADKWYIAWNAFGLGNVMRSTGNLEDAKNLYRESKDAFMAQNQTTLVGWVDKALNEIESDTLEPSEIRIWLCPLCGSKFSAHQVAALKAGKSTKCQYCGTTSG